MLLQVLTENMNTKNWGFCDLFVNKCFELNKLHLLEKLHFNTIAINTFVEEPSDEPKKKKKKGETREKKDYIPSPVDIPNDVIESTGLNILQRVTIEFSDSSVAHKLNQSENLKKFNIVAVIPKTLQAFQYACSSMDIDLITFEPQNRLPFKVSRKLYMQAVDRGIFFELMYSPAIKDSTSRKNIINTAHTYHAIGKSKNIVLNSGADCYMQARDVHDVINLGFILGLNNNESLEVVRNNARQLILKAEGRRCGKHFMLVETISKTEENKNMENYIAFYLNWNHEFHYK